MISTSEAVVHPYTVMISSRDTRFADTTVFTPRWLVEFARSTFVARVEQYPVIRVVSHLLRMIQLRNGALGISLGA